MKPTNENREQKKAEKQTDNMKALAGKMDMKTKQTTTGRGGRGLASLHLREASPAPRG